MRNKYVTLLNEIKNKFLVGKEFVPLHEPVFGGNEKKYLTECIDSGFVSSVGEFVNLFEKKLSDYTGSDYTVATVNGTSALHTALMVAGVKQNEEVITQAITFIATTNAISYTGATPVFIDIDPVSLSISPEELDRFFYEQTELKSDGYRYNKTTERRIAACIPVHVFGFIGEIERIVQICHSYRVPVIEDAAEALGSNRNSISAGGFGDIGTFSFNGNKIVTSGGGGAIVTNNEEYALKAKHITTTAKVGHPWKYEHDMVGYNYRMPNINAALLCAQMEQLNSFLSAKKRVNQFYMDLFEELEIDSVGGEKNSDSNNWLVNMILNSEEERDEFLKVANESGIMSRPLWTPMHELPMFKNCPSFNLEQTDYFSKRIVNLPSSANLL